MEEGGLEAKRAEATYVLEKIYIYTDYGGARKAERGNMYGAFTGSGVRK